MKKKYNFTDIRIGFACSNELDEKIIDECKRLCETKSSVIRRALIYYFDKNKGGK